MRSIGRTHHNKCTHTGCTKRRPYWSMFCKGHRVEFKSTAVKSSKSPTAATVARINALTKQIEEYEWSDGEEEKAGRELLALQATRDELERKLARKRLRTVNGYYTVRKGV